MNLRQMFLALTLVPAVQVSATAQRVFSEWDETREMLSQERPIETAATNAPAANAPAPPPPPAAAAVATAAAVAAAPPAATTAAAAAAERAAGTPDTAKPALLLPAPVPTPLSNAFKHKMYEDSYMDAYRILKEENSCSRFFGGPAQATEVLNHLAKQLRKKRFEDANVAIKMSGPIMLVRDNMTGASYRLFEQVSVNTIGPLYIPPLQARSHRRLIGRFSSDTRAARALILLHEIGHLVPGADGEWLLPNDGHDAQLSGRNTNTVQSYCLKQLSELKH